MTWEEDFDTLNATSHKLSFFNLRVLVPRHKALSGETLLLPTEEVTTVLGHEVLVPLEEVEDEVVDLWIVRLSQRLCKVLLVSV